MKVKIFLCLTLLSTIHVASARHLKNKSFNNVDANQVTTQRLVARDVSIGNGLEVFGNEILHGNLAVGGSLNVAGNASIGGTLTANTFAGTFSGAVTNIGGDTGFATPNAAGTIWVDAGVATRHSGSSVSFSLNGTSTVQLNVTDSNLNTLVGQSAGSLNNTNGSNTGLGINVLANANGAFNNVAIGRNALLNISSGGNDVAVGMNALTNITTGNNNIAIGFNAGSNYATVDSNNIVLTHTGVAGESATIRIGVPGVQTRCFIAGISGVTTGLPAVGVFVANDGQLGVASSSRRYKQCIEDMCREESCAVMKLRPVTFCYKADECQKRHYGLIAEEVAEVMPELVHYNNDGAPETVYYHEIPVILLREIQRLNDVVEKQCARIEQLECVCKRVEECEKRCGIRC